MFKSNLIGKMLASFVVFAIGSLAHAACCPPAPAADCCGTAVAASPCAPAATVTRQVTVNEWVPESYEAFRTTYKTEYVPETYTATRWDCVPETRTITKHVTRVVTECKDEVRTVYKCVPTVETRTVNKVVHGCRQVTVMEKKVVDQGHWECQTVEKKKGFCARIKDRFKPKDPCQPECPEYETKKVWVPCKVCVECPVVKTEKFTTCVPEVVTVTVNKLVPHTETVKVTYNRCVTDCVPETITVQVKKCVTYTATRTVAKCVPVTEKYTATRMVCRPVVKTVVEAAPCSTGCSAAPACGCDPCAAPVCCEEAPAKKKCGLFGRLLGRN